MNCDSIARIYRWIEYAVFGRTLEHCRFVHLSRLETAKRILVLGEGDGRSLQRLLAAAPGAAIDDIDSSARMLTLARHRTGDPARVSFYQLDAIRCEHWPHPDYDAIVTQFFLDCFPEREAAIVIERLGKSLRPGGNWLVSEFAIPEKGWRRWHAAVWIRIMYGFFGTATGLRARALPPYEKLLSDSGMVLGEVFESRFGMMRSEVWTKAV